MTGCRGKSGDVSSTTVQDEAEAGSRPLARDMSAALQTSDSGAKEQAAASEEAAPSDAMQVTLWQAAAEGRLDAVRQAVEKGIAVDAREDNGNTALMLAAFEGREAVVQYLLEQGADVNAANRGGQTALMAAASGPSPGTVKLLLEKGADVNARENTEMFTALMFAAAEGQLDNVRVLLRFGADKTLKDVDGETAADFARQNEHAEVVQLLGQ
jgi:ankyrin repeat protein